MQRSIEKLYKETGTPVFVRVGLALQLVLLNIKDWQQELKDIWATHIKLNTSGLYELPVEHGISFNCCSKVIRQKSYTHPFDYEVRERVHINLADPG